MESVSRRCLIELAYDLCSDWKKLGYVLGLSKEVEQIKQDNRKNVVEQAYRILQAWKQKNGSKATYQLLGEALRKETMSRIDLAEKYCEGGSQGSPETGIIPPEHFKSGRISDSDVDGIANDLGIKWVWVGRLLELEDTSLDDIKECNDKQYDCSHEMLRLWTQKNSTQATYEWLAQALLHGAVGMRIVVEKYCLNEHRESQSASYVPPEDIQSLNTKMEKLQVCVPKETGYNGNCSRNADVEKVNKNQTGSTHQTPVPDDCIRKNFISILPYKVWGALVVKLDPPREFPLRGDFKGLAEELGFDTETILYFKSLQNPTETVLNSRSSLTVEKLCNKLEVIGRVDARMVIDDWVKSQDCKCAACTNQDSS